MVGLDGRGGAAPSWDAFDHIRIQRALRQKLRIGNPLGFLLEHPNELFPDDLALLLRVGDPGQPFEKSWRGIHNVQLEVDMWSPGVGDILSDPAKGGGVEGPPERSEE